VLVAATIDARAQEPLPRQILHDSNCDGCHDSRVYAGEDRPACNYRGIRAQVRRWEQEIGLNWDDADIERASSCIGSRFYKLACPEAC
jgi:hypothetical protein